LVQPSTVLQWHRAGFRLFWRWKSCPHKSGRKTIAPDTIHLIDQMSRTNPLWGAPRIHGELLKLGLTIAQRTVAKYMIPRVRRPVGSENLIRPQIVDLQRLAAELSPPVSRALARSDAA
jgi:hypothetical protein